MVFKQILLKRTQSHYSPILSLSSPHPNIIPIPTKLQLSTLLVVSSNTPAILKGSNNVCQWCQCPAKTTPSLRFGHKLVQLHTQAVMNILGSCMFPQKLQVGKKYVSFLLCWCMLSGWQPPDPPKHTAWNSAFWSFQGWNLFTPTERHEETEQGEKPKLCYQPSVGS